MNRTQTAILIGVYATLALDVYSTLTSSPQTTEINAQARAGTLMKWVKLATIVAIGGGVAGSVVEGNAIPAVAAGTVAVLMYVLYEHAKRSGLENGGPSTEDVASSAAGLVWSFA